MPNPDPGSGPSNSEPKPVEGLSQFIGKVLDQLSISAWLPAAMLVGCGAVLIQLRAQNNADLGAALIALTAKPLGILVVVVFAMILATMISQAFSFTAIRLLEGYWPAPLINSGLYGVMIRHHAQRKKQLRQKLDEAERLALDTALSRMRAVKIPPHIVQIIEAIETAEDVNGDGRWSSTQLAEAQRTDWHRFSPAETLGRQLRLTEVLGEYPGEHRMMPTRLGNVLRATEDRITPAGGDTQALMLSRGDAISPRLRLHHDQFRTRLDMYCTLVFVQMLLAALAIVLLTTTAISGVVTALIVIGFVVLTLVSYYAAIASARGYCTVLREIFDSGDMAESSANDEV